MLRKSYQQVYGLATRRKSYEKVHGKTAPTVEFSRYAALACSASCGNKIVYPVCVDAVGYTMDTVYFGWIDDPVQIDVDVQFPQFKLIESLLYDCSMNYTAGTICPIYIILYIVYINIP